MERHQCLKAPAWRVSQWLNTQEPIELEAQRGRVIVACAFQMLCPGCVSQAIPQLKAIHQHFASEDVLVIGIHSVFEHHQAMTVTALEAFLSENQIRFPVAVDQHLPDGGGTPETMKAYKMRGTPTWLLIDRNGDLRHQAFGHVEDLRLGAEIARLALESVTPVAASNV